MSRTWSDMTHAWSGWFHHQTKLLCLYVISCTGCSVIGSCRHVWVARLLRAQVVYMLHMRTFYTSLYHWFALLCWLDVIRVTSVTTDTLYILTFYISCHLYLIHVYVNKELEFELAVALRVVSLQFSRCTPCVHVLFWWYHSSVSGMSLTNVG